MADEPNAAPQPSAAPAFNAEAPEVKALIEAAVKDATSGLAANRDEILGEKKTLQQSLDEMKKTWGSYDPEAVKNIMSRLENDEEAKLLAEGKTDEVIARRTERLQADHAKQLKNLTDQLNEKDTQLNGTTSRVKELMVSGTLRQAAVEQGLVPSAIEDALSRAMNVFKVGDNDELFAEENGSTAYGKDGKTPLTPGEWLESMKDKAPHWFPAPSGGGAGGGSVAGVVR